MQTSEEHTLKESTFGIHSYSLYSVYTQSTLVQYTLRQTTAHTKGHPATRMVHAFYVEFLGLASDMIFPSFKVGKDTRVGK